MASGNWRTQNMNHALKGKTDIGEQINKKIIAQLATTNKPSNMSGR